jgi:hypothetical protein
MPDKPRAALLCFHPKKPAEATYWDTIEDASQAMAELANPCGPRCIGVHSVVALDPEPPPPRPRGRHPASFLP